MFQSILCCLLISFCLQGIAESLAVKSPLVPNVFVQDEFTRLALCVPGDDITPPLAPDPNSPAQIQKYNEYSNSYQNKRSFLNSLCSNSMTELFYDLPSNNNLFNLYNRNAGFNANSLIGPTLYTLVQKNNKGAIVNPVALDYIRYLSGTAKPLKLPEFITKQTFENNEKVQDGETLNSRSSKEFLVALRNYEAAISAANNALSHLYTERLPVINATKSMVKAKIPTQIVDGQLKTSSLAIQKHMATWRIMDPDWNKGLSNTLVPTATLERELLQVAAEQLYQTYQLRSSIDQLNLTMASMVFLLSQNAPAVALN